MTLITVAADTDDRASLEGVRALADQLLGQLSAPRVAEVMSEASDSPIETDVGEMDLAERFINDLWNRAPRGRALVSVMASFDERFTLVDIAEQTGETLAKTHSAFAQLHRSVKAARSNVPGAPELVIGHQQVEGLWQFSMDESIRSAVRRAEERDE